MPRSRSIQSEIKFVFLIVAAVTLTALGILIALARCAEAAEFEFLQPKMLAGLHATAPLVEVPAGAINFKAHLVEPDATNWVPPLLFAGVQLPAGQNWKFELLGGVAFSPENPSPIVSVRPLGRYKVVTFWATIEYYPLQGHMLFTDINPTVSLGKIVSVGVESENWVVPADGSWHASLGPHAGANIGDHVAVGTTLFVATDNGDGGYLRPRFSFNLFF